MPPTQPRISALLQELTQGRSDALERLLPIVYDTLRDIAGAKLRGEREGHVLDATALVHETYLRLIKLERIDWRDRVHFFAVAARMMRQILIDHARATNREKRGGGAIRVSLSQADEVPIVTSEEIAGLEEALARLEHLNARQCRVVECRCFSGLSIDETAAALGISAATAKRDWASSLAWLSRELSPDRPS
jgi:RNA polymerase sigma factor (TIGR02999 family)